MRKVPCPYCKGEVLTEQTQRTSTSQPIFPRMQNVLSAVGDALSLITGPKKTSRKKAMGGKCKTCGDTRFIDDVTDTSKQDKAAADYLKGKANRILECEKRLGKSPGGNMVRRVAGAKIEIIGRTLNTAKSYTVHKGKNAAPDGATLAADGRAGLVTGPEKNKGGNIVTGNNVPANTGGGLYYIQCGNKFKVVAGSQGIEFSTTGPISFDGGITRFTGAEVAIGSKTGQTLLEGDDVIIKSGHSLTFSPGKSGKGCANITSSLAVGGNIQAGGLATENAWVVNMTMPEKQDSTKISAGGTDLVGGPAIWGGPQVRAQLIAAQNLVKWATDSVGDPIMAGALLPLNPRAKMKMNDNIANTIYSKIPTEPLPTGLILPGTPITITGTCPCNQGGIAGGVITGVVTAPIPFNNFPHTHGMPDEPHVHNFSGPAINYKGQSAKSVHAEAAAAGINSTIPASHPGAGGDPLTKVLALPGKFVSAIGGIINSFKSPYTS